MNPNSIPQQLASIPYGQIFILTSPSGITLKTSQMIWVIQEYAQHFIKEPILHTMPIENPELWDCAVCKIGDEVIIADKDSLLEMLCELWGLDYDDVRSNIDFRYRPRIYPIEGEIHPIKVPIITDNGESPLVKAGDTPTMEMIRAYSNKAGALGDIRSILQSGFNQQLGISALDLMTLYDEEEKRQKKTWLLDIKIGKGKMGYNVNIQLVEKVKCEIYLVDPEGTTHLLDIKAQELALYLTYILFKDGVKPTEIGRKDFYTIFKTICERLPYVNSIPDCETLVKNAGRKRSNIKKLIEGIIKDEKYLIDEFAIEGYDGEPYKVAAATDEHRENIKKAFGIE